MWRDMAIYMTYSCFIFGRIPREPCSDAESVRVILFFFKEDTTRLCWVNLRVRDMGLLTLVMTVSVLC